MAKSGCLANGVHHELLGRGLRRCLDPSDGAAIVELELGKQKVPLLAWNDVQLGGTLFRGEDKAGRTAALLFDGVRVSLEDTPD